MNAALVERAQAGDRDAYEQLARGAARRLFLVASRILRDVDAAEAGEGPRLMMVELATGRTGPVAAGGLSSSGSLTWLE